MPSAEAGHWGFAVAEIIVNSERSLLEAQDYLAALFARHKFISFTPAVSKKKRSLDQNAHSHVWYAQLAETLPEDDARGWKRYCKLVCGVPLLRAESEQFRALYDKCILRALTYEEKLEAMDILPVTSLMSTLQMDKFMHDVQAHFIGRCKLEFPPE